MHDGFSVGTNQMDDGPCKNFFEMVTGGRLVQIDLKLRLKESSTGGDLFHTGASYLVICR